ncbi:hypothetical protein [Marmoricola sp. RAF53]|uniref:hypothetical protein n=1 Tax=Marmoricola sp. RAF53 TaxID=3233059 RepID=UPI003F94900A
MKKHLCWAALCAAALTAALAASPSVGASAAPAPGAAARAGTDAIASAIASGASDATLRHRFGLVAETGTSGRGAAAPVPSPAARVAVPERAAGCGEVLRVGGSPTYMKMAAPRFYRNTRSTGAPYYVAASFHWDKGDRLLWSGWSCTGAIGGRDGIGLTVDQSVVRISQSLSLCAYGVCKTGRGKAVLADNNAHGASYTYVDTATSLGADWYSGTITVGFKYKYPKRCHQAFAKYAHTWSTTKVNGIGVGPYSLSVSWSSSAHRWAVASSTGRNSRC